MVPVANAIAYGKLLERRERGERLSADERVIAVQATFALRSLGMRPLGRTGPEAAREALAIQLRAAS
jgi:hypothetical protein